MDNGNSYKKEDRPLGCDRNKLTSFPGVLSMQYISNFANRMLVFIVLYLPIQPSVILTIGPVSMSRHFNVTYTRNFYDAIITENV